MAHACHPEAAEGSLRQEDHGPEEPALKNQDPISKIAIAKWAGGMAQVVESLPRKH
jgi:hypothetical protein